MNELMAKVADFVTAEKDSALALLVSRVSQVVTLLGSPACEEGSDADERHFGE